MNAPVEVVDGGTFAVEPAHGVRFPREVSCTRIEVLGQHVAVRARRW